MGFQAFFDDSGHAVPVFVLSGYVDQVNKWEKFSDDWQKCLDDEPRLEYFKMSEAAGLSGQFAGFKWEQRSERIKKFFEVIKNSVHLSAASVIPIKPFNRIWKGNISEVVNGTAFTSPRYGM